MSRFAKVSLVIAAVLLLGWATWLSVFRYECLPDTLVERVGFIASVATLIALIYTVIQVSGTKALARATKDAADKAVLEMRGNEYRHALLRAVGLLSEIRTHLLYRTWRIAALRLHDLADQCLNLARIRPGVDDQWQHFAKAVQWWGSQFEHGQNNRAFEYDSDKWRELDQGLWEKLNRESQPFAWSENQE